MSERNDASETVEDEEEEEDGLGEGEWETREGGSSDDESDNELIQTENDILGKDKKETRTDAWFAKVCFTLNR